MMTATLLIAEREFRTYVATLSFWVSLAIGPVVAGLAMALSGAPPAPLHISIQGNDTKLVQSAILAVREAGRLEGHAFVLDKNGSAIVVKKQPPRGVELTFSANFPLSATGRAMVSHVLERDLAWAASPDSVFAVHQNQAVAAAAGDEARLPRLASMMMLWLTLTGSLGMLLQAVVRERANRALETLLAAVPAWQIVAGKMLGIGAVSLLVLISWFGSAAILSAISPSGWVSLLLAQVAQPRALVRDLAIYICAFCFYGAATVALGSRARDSASAQNMVRPMFVLLLAAFVIALGSENQSQIAFLTYVPPLTPFLLLANSPETVAISSQVLLLIGLLGSSIMLMLLAARLLSIAPSTDHIFRRSGA